MRQMTPGDALLLHATLPPAHITTRRWFEERSLRTRAQLKPPDQLLRDPSRPALGRRRGRPGGGGDDVVDDLSVLDLFPDRAEAMHQLELLGAPAPAAHTSPDAGT
jgi:hypothetical protein